MKPAQAPITRRTKPTRAIRNTPARLTSLFRNALFEANAGHEITTNEANAGREITTNEPNAGDETNPTPVMKSRRTNPRPVMKTRRTKPTGLRFPDSRS